MGSRGPVSRKNAKSVRTDAGVRLRQLPSDGDAIFKRLAKDIDGLSAADVALLELMSYWMEIAKDCRRQLARPEPKATDDAEAAGLVLTVADTTHGDGTEERKNPILIVLRTATEQIRALAAQLGASPMARARLPDVAPVQMSLAEMLFVDVDKSSG
jgi:P27 family predicted phage terminase small subunit